MEVKSNGIPSYPLRNRVSQKLQRYHHGLISKNHFPDQPVDGWASLPPMTLSGKSGGRISPHDLGYHTLRTPTPPVDVKSTAVWGTLAPPVGRPSSVPPLLGRRRRSPSCSDNIPSSRSSPFPFPQELNHTTTNYNNTTSSESSTRTTSGCGGIPPLLENTDRLISTFKVKKQPRGCPFDRLSDELILKIFSYSSSNQLCVCARVCRRWYFLAWEPQLWTSVTLNGSKIHVDRGLKTLFRLLCRDSPTVCMTVERISLSGCTRLTDKGLGTLAARCPELKTLELKGCVNVTNNGISDVVSRSCNLERLDVTGCLAVTSIYCRPMTPESTSTTASYHQMCLQYLDLTDCQCLEDSGLQEIVRNSPQLSHLYLRRCCLVTDVGLKAIASFSVALRELSVSDCVLITDFGLYGLAKRGSNLRYLSVAKCDQVSDAGIKQIARQCYKLRYLNVRGCEAVSDDALEVIARSCPRLRALDIGKCDVSDKSLRTISQNCPNLRKLSVKSCEMITDNGIQLVAYYCRGLQQLNIQDCHISLNGYRTVKKFCKRCIIEHTNPGFS